MAADKSLGERIRAAVENVREKRKWKNTAKRRKDNADTPEEYKRRLSVLEKLRKALSDALARLKGLRKRRKPKGLGSLKPNTAPGAPHWGGGGDIMSGFVIPFMNGRGLPTGSGKRTPAENARVGGSPTSDHLTTHTATDARDFPTYSGEDDARALALALGASSWSPNSYASFYIVVNGVRYRVQILWGAAIGHGDHVHVGIGRA